MKKTFQKTLKEAVSIEGIGLHTGKICKLKLIPLPEDQGIQFQRMDLKNQPIIEAVVENVQDTDRSILLQKGEASIQTPEHLLAALGGLQIDNVLIQIDTEEIPIVDGSAKPFIELCEAVGVIMQEKEKRALKLQEPITYQAEEGAEIIALPYEGYHITTLLDYPNKNPINKQYATVNVTKNFSNIASARTFCFLSEVEMLYQKSFIKGGSLENAIVIIDHPYNESLLKKLKEMFKVNDIKITENYLLHPQKPLRDKNEPVKHKLLDLVGDLTLLGRPIRAKIIATKPNHNTNIQFVKHCKKMLVDHTQSPINLNAMKTIYDINQIQAILPHRYPFRLLDKIIQIDDHCITGIKNTTINEPYFEGHFPDNPIMPGVLQIEAIAQTGGILVIEMLSRKLGKGKWNTFLVGIENCKFKKKIIPGDVLVIKCLLNNPIKFGFCKMDGKIFIQQELACEATLSAKVMKIKG